MPFVQRTVQPRHLGRTRLYDEEGRARVEDGELEAVTNGTLSNALRQLASLLMVADDIFTELGGQLQAMGRRSEALKLKMRQVEERVDAYDPKKVTVPESDICSFALLKQHYSSGREATAASDLFSVETRPRALRALYQAANRTPVHAMRQLDRWRRDGHRSSRFFLCTPVLGRKSRRRLRCSDDVDADIIDIETRLPAAVEELRRWTSAEALGDITVTPDCPNKIVPNVTLADGDAADGTVVSDDEGIDHKLPSPEEQLQVVALKFPAEIVAVDVSGRSFDRMSAQRRSLLHTDITCPTDGEPSGLKRRPRTRKPRNRRRNTLAGTDQKEIQSALAGEDASSSPLAQDAEPTGTGAVCRSKSSDILRSSTKKEKESPENKKSHFNTLKQWGKSRYDKFMNKSSESRSDSAKKDDPETANIYETVTLKRNRNVDKTKKKTHGRSASVSSSERSNASIPVATPLASALNAAVKLRDSSLPRRRRSGGKDEPHSSSGNWSASSESGRTSIASESTTTTHPKSTTSNATSNNSLNQQPPSSVNSRRRFNINMSASGSVTSEGTLTPDIIHDLHEDGETSSVYSCDTEGYYTSFHMDSGLKTLKEEDTPSTPLHSTSAFSNSSSNNTILTAENEYELFGKGSTSTTTSSAGTVCTTLRASESRRSLTIGPAVPERKSSLSKLSNNTSPESSLERDQSSSDKTGTVKRSPTSSSKAVQETHKQNTGDVSPDSGHNTSSSPIESINSPNGVRSGSEFEFSESSDMEGAERIERIRVKTTINSSRIPSMCVITPPHSDDESIKSYSPQVGVKNPPDFMKPTNLGSKISDKTKLDLPIKQTTGEIIANDELDKKIEMVNKQNKIQLINVNPQSGYATVETIDAGDCDINKNSTKLPSNIKEAQRAATDSVGQQGKALRAPSPSGGTMIIKEDSTNSKSPPSQPIFKASLMPLNNMFGKLKLNIASVMHRRESKSPQKPEEVCEDGGEYVTIADVRNNNEKAMPRQQEETCYANDIVNKNLKTILTGKLKETEYVSLNELPSSETTDDTSTSASDSLERKRRQGARVTLDAEGKVVYTSDSLKRRKGAHTTFEPGPFVKTGETPSPLPVHRTPKNIRPVTNSGGRPDKLSSAPNADASRPLSPQFGKIVIKAATGNAAPAAEIVRMPPTTIVTPTATRSLSPKPTTVARGAYVHVQDAQAAQDKDRVPSPNQPPMHPGTAFGNHPPSLYPSEMGYRSSSLDRSGDTRRYLESQYYFQKGNPMYQTLPSKRTQYLMKDAFPERSVTPDITRGLERNFSTLRLDHTRDSTVQVAHKQRIVTPIPQYANQQYIADNSLLNMKLGIPVPVPQVGSIGRTDVPSPEYQQINQYQQGNQYQPSNQYQQENLYQQANQYQQTRQYQPVNQYQQMNQYQQANQYQQMNQSYAPTCVSPQMVNRYSPVRSSSPYKSQDQTDAASDSLKISPIDPRSIGSFKSSTPSSKGPEIKAATNLESKLLSPKRSSMSNEQLYAVIHKSKKKMNIDTEADRPPLLPPAITDPDEAREATKSPETGYLGDKTRSRFSWSPTKGKTLDFNATASGDARSRMSWACNDRKPPQQTSRLDFKKLLLQKSSVLSPPPKKLSAVEQLKMSKQHLQPSKSTQQQQPEMSILELSGSPRSLVNRKFAREPPTSPKNSADKAKPAPKLMSPRSQWRFANPRTDVLSSTILEDCREDESPNNSYEKKKRCPQSSTQVSVESVERNPENAVAYIRTTVNSKENPQNANLDVQKRDACVNAETQKSDAAPPPGTKTYTSISQRIQAQRARFFSSGSPANPAPQDGYSSQFSSQNPDNNACSKQSALETAF